jgi:hypothetical protein
LKTSFFIYTALKISLITQKNSLPGDLCVTEKRTIGLAADETTVFQVI